MSMHNYDDNVAETKAFVTKLVSALEAPHRKIMTQRHEMPANTLGLHRWHTIVDVLSDYDPDAEPDRHSGRPRIARITVRDSGGRYRLSSRTFPRLQLDMNVPYYLCKTVRRTVRWKNLTQKALDAIVERVKQAEVELAAHDQRERERRACATVDTHLLESIGRVLLTQVFKSDCEQSPDKWRGVCFVMKGSRCLLKLDVALRQLQVRYRGVRVELPLNTETSPWRIKDFVTAVDGIGEYARLHDV